jgi:hypothetical protein
MRLFLIGMLACLTVHAATWNPATCSQANVASAASSAARGDTILVPEGNCTWASRVTLTKGVTLTGAGVGSTVITSSGGTILLAVEPDATAIANEENIAISGFTFDGAGASSIMLRIQGASGISGTKPYRYLIVHHNKFQNANNTSSSAVIESGANENGQIRGVIYSNTFDRCNIILRIFSNNDTDEWSNTAFNQLAYGTGDNLFFEDNTIMFSSSYGVADSNPGWTETGQGGRLVVRYNTWNFENAARQQEIWDIHGFQGWNGTPDSGNTGTMQTEYYGNTITNAGTYRWIDHRATWGLFHNNVLTGTGGNSIELYGMSAGAACASNISPTPSYIPIVNNTYFINNSKNGTVLTAEDGGGIAYMSCTPAENVNWWNYNASCTASSCAAGVGRGTTAPTGTCTTGTAYWVASTATPTTDSAVLQVGHLYKCTSTNTWTNYYTPYTYPHPLRGGSTPVKSRMASGRGMRSGRVN